MNQLQLLKEKAREDWVNYKGRGVITHEEEWLTEMTDRTATAVLDMVSEKVKELGEQQDDDTIWCNMDELLADIAALRAEITKAVCSNFHSANEFCQGCGWLKEKHGAEIQTNEGV